MTRPDALATSVADRYELLRELGEGGMATVYLARDLRHDREVALKVLKPELGVVLGADRFLTEIAVTARLQHPNLLPLFDSGGGDGVLWYVMPFVEGETLRARLDREQQLPVAEAIRLVTAIASALEYAHARGVVHRDLKPENVLLQAGQPVVADFGIALAVRNAGGARVTATGLSLGTPLYMSPEQAAGERAVDARSDVYALGAMAYEMLTGTPPITGPSVPVIMAKLMTEQPAPLTTVRRTIPPHVNDAVLQALEKLPADRFQSAAAFAAALAGAGAVTTRASTAAGDGARQGRGASRVLLAGVSAIAVAATATAGWLAWRGTGRTAATETVGYFSLALPDSTGLPPLIPGRQVALSQDGRTMAVLLRRGATREAWVRRSGEEAMSPVPGSAGASSLALSPDGTVLLATIARDQLVRIPLDGRASQVVLREPAGGDWIGAATALDGDRFVFSKGTALWIVDGPGRAPRRLLGASGTVSAYAQPSALPGGTHVLAIAVPRDSSGRTPIAIVSIAVADGRVSETGATGVMPQYIAPGWLLHGASTGTVVAEPFSLRTRTVEGAPITVAQRVGSAGGPTYPIFAAADNGWLVSGSGTGGQIEMGRFVSVDVRGRSAPLPFPEARYADTELSPDGRRLVSGISRDGSLNGTDLHVLDLATGTTTRLTDDAASYRATWTPDGRSIWFVRGGSSRSSQIWSMPADAGAPPTMRVPRAGIAEVRVGPPGAWFVYRTFGSRDVFIAPSTAPDSLRPLFVTPHNETDVRLSRDGRWMAYASDETGASEIFLRPLPGPGGRIAISAGRGVLPRFDARGALYYLGGDGGSRMIRVTLALGAEATVVRRDTLFTAEEPLAGRTYEVLPGGDGFVWLAASAARPARDELRVLVGLPAQLARTSGAARTP